MHPGELLPNQLLQSTSKEREVSWSKGREEAG